MIFFCGVLLFVVVVVKFPITMHVDKVGDILLPYNILVYQWTNNIDVCNQLIHNYIKYITVKVKIFHLEKNLTDPFTNNLGNGTFEYLTSRYLHCE